MSMIPAAGVPPTNFGPSPALDALRQLGTASPASGMVPNMNRLTEAKEPIPSPATPPSEVPTEDIILQSLRMAYGTPPTLEQHFPSTYLRGPKLEG